MNGSAAPGQAVHGHTAIPSAGNPTTSSASGASASTPRRAPTNSATNAATSPAGQPDPPDDAQVTADELLAAIGHAVIATAPDGTIVHWNPAAERVYGWTAQEVIGRNIADVTVPEMSQQTGEDIMAALRAGTAWSGGFPVRRRDGSVFPALVTDAGVYRAGRLVAIVGVSANLGSALEPLLERSSDAALVLTAGAIVTYASPAVTPLFGWQADEIVGTSLSLVVHPDDRADFAEHLRTAAQPGRYEVLELRVHSDDHWAYAELSLTNLLDDPVVRGVIVNLRHSVRRAEQEAAERRAEQLQGALESRVVIEQAKGYLAALTGASPDETFEAIRGFARSHNMTAHEVARGVLDRRLKAADLV